MNKLVLKCVLLFSGLVLNSAKASVTVSVNQEQYVFTHEPYMAEVLAPIADQEKWYWPAAALYQAEDIQLEETRRLVLKRLSKLIKHYRKKEPETSRSLEQLQTTIASWRLARRLPIKVDYDLARIVTANNPRFPKGKYILDIAPRKNTVQLFGAVFNTVNVPHQPYADISEYITEQIRTGLANNDQVILIQADGRKMVVPVAYWNKTHQEVMPGSLLFMPFSESLFYPEFAVINQQIMTLALNRLW